jgi:DNA-binding transcriptional LysR family regulator
MTFEQLEYYRSSAILKSFSRAAQYHFVSESTLSRQISSLEKDLGVMLFERGARGVELTRAGVLFFGKTMEMFQQLGEYRGELVKEGIVKDEADPFFRIACSMEDNVFPLLVEMLEVLPEGWSGRQYKIDILRAGAPAKAVLGGAAHVGIDRKAELRRYGQVFDMQVFARAAVSQPAGKAHDQTGADEGAGEYAVFWRKEMSGEPDIVIFTESLVLRQRSRK